MTNPLPPFVLPTREEMDLASMIVDSQPVVSAYASAEWCELGEDGQVWIAAIVRAARKGATDDVKALCERVFLAGHSDGWRGNQLRRDTADIDARKSWEMFVENGAFAKVLATSAPAVDAVELAAFGASEHASALYPGFRQAAERAAFIAGAAHQAKSAVDSVPAGEGVEEPDWTNAATCLENMQIAYDDALGGDLFGDGDFVPTDTVVNAGDLGVLIGLARYAVALSPIKDLS